MKKEHLFFLYDLIYDLVDGEEIYWGYCRGSRREVDKERMEVLNALSKEIDKKYKNYRDK